MFIYIHILHELHINYTTPVTSGRLFTTYKCVCIYIYIHTYGMCMYYRERHEHLARERLFGQRRRVAPGPC